MKSKSPIKGIGRLFHSSCYDLPCHRSKSYSNTSKAHRACLRQKFLLFCRYLTVLLPGAAVYKDMDGISLPPKQQQNVPSPTNSALRLEPRHAHSPNLPPNRRPRLSKRASPRALLASVCTSIHQSFRGYCKIDLLIRVSLKAEKYFLMRHDECEKDPRF